MQCHWIELLNVIPPWMRAEVERVGKDKLLEIRMRINMKTQLLLLNDVQWLEKASTCADLQYCINAATKYSPWTAGTLTQGYVTAAGGHRIGICGVCIYDNGALKNISQITSVCIRVARDIPDVSADLYRRRGSILIIGSPGTGKTTFLRDLVRKVSNYQKGSVTVIDERREIYPDISGEGFDRGKQTDVLLGCKKTEGIDMVLRTMNPAVIAIDEITNEKDCIALSRAAWCGVRLFATAHAANKNDLFQREVYKPILKHKIFDILITLHPDKTWQEEFLNI